MRTRSGVLLSLMLCAAAALAILLAWQRLAKAQQEFSAAQAAVVQTERDSQTIIRLRKQSPIIETRQRPTQDVIAQVNAVLAETGIPTTHLQSLTPEGDAPADGPGATNQGRQGGPSLRQQSLRLTLQGLAPGQIGQFLMHWHAVQKVWSAARLELVHHSARESSSANVYDATIVMTAKYLSESAPSLREPR